MHCFPLSDVSFRSGHQAGGTKETHINFDLLSVGILNGWVIALYPHILDELGCRGHQSVHVEEGTVRRREPVKQLLPTPPFLSTVSEVATGLFGVRGSTGSEDDDVVLPPRHNVSLVGRAAGGWWTANLCDITNYQLCFQGDEFFYNGQTGVEFMRCPAHNSRVER